VHAILDFSGCRGRMESWCMLSIRKHPVTALIPFVHDRKHSINVTSERSELHEEPAAVMIGCTGTHSVHGPQ